MYGLFPSLYILKHKTFRKLGLFPTSGERLEGNSSDGPIGKNEGLGLAFSNEPNRVSVSQPSPEDGTRPWFRNVVFFRIPGDVQSPET
jgi:hypothetical protein